MVPSPPVFPSCAFKHFTHKYLYFSGHRRYLIPGYIVVADVVVVVDDTDVADVAGVADVVDVVDAVDVVVDSCHDRERSRHFLLERLDRIVVVQLENI